MTKLTYTSKKDALDKGFCKKKSQIYKKTVLEMWFDKGWLELDDSQFDGALRLEYGLRLMFDFSIINKSNIRSNLSELDIVDCKNNFINSSLPDSINRYNKAIRSVPKEFWPIVKTICLDDQTPVFPKDLSERQKAYSYYLARTDLCRGLDRVIISYTQK